MSTYHNWYGPVSTDPNRYEVGHLGAGWDTRELVDRNADPSRTAVVVVTTDDDGMPSFEVIDVRKPKPPTTWLVVTSNGTHWRATSDDDARDTLRQAGGHAWRYDPDGTVTEVTP